jgi:hypothetical protein
MAALPGARLPARQTRGDGVTSRPPPRHVPTLTQVIDAPRLQRNATTAPASTPAHQARLTMVTPEFEDSVRSQILNDLKVRIDGVIDERLYRDLEPLVTSVMEEFSAKLQDRVRQTLTEVIAEAVEQAIVQEEQRASRY